MRRRILALPVVFAIMAIPGSLAAQACIGIPVAESRSALSAEVGFPEDAMSYGAAFRHNLVGPLSVSAGYGLSSFNDVEPKMHSLGAEANYEVPGLSFSACPTTGLGYSRIAEEGVTVSSFSIPVGVGFGTTLQLSNQVSLVPHVVPQWVWTRATVDFDGDSVSDNDSAFAAQFGATFALQRFYVGGRVLWIDRDDVDPVFAIMAGLPF